MTKLDIPADHQMVKFGDIAEHISIRVNPVSGDELKYIGLEHLDSGSLKVKRWGSEVALKGQKLGIKKGDILFAKRNAYLKRIAIAPFDGIFSAHGMVIRAISGKIIPEFLPFFMQSDLFMNRAIAISEGSLSPTIKWKTLSEQKFVIPNVVRQKELCTILSKHAEVLESYEDCIISCNSLLESAISKKLFIFNPFETTYQIPSNWRVKSLDDIAKVERGKFTPRPRNNPIYYNGDYPFIQTADVGKADLFIRNHEQTLNEKGLSVSKLFPENTIFVTIAANIGDVAISTYPVAATDSIVALRPNSDVDPLWLLFYMRGIKKYLDGIATESAQKNINLAILKPLKIVVPPFEYQKKIGMFLLNLKVEQERLISSKHSVSVLPKGFM